MMFLVYAATGDFYEQYGLKAVVTKMKLAHEMAREIKKELSDVDKYDGYGENLVFIREVESNEVFACLFSMNEIPNSWFV